MTRPQTVPAALDEAEHLAVYNSRQQVGSVIERRTGRRRFIAFTPDGHRVGSYADTCALLCARCRHPTPMTPKTNQRRACTRAGLRFHRRARPASPLIERGLRAGRLSR
jgi:hypothetical protein